MLSHPKIAPVIGRGDVGGRPWIAFDCDATIDTVDIIAAFAHAGIKTPLGCADSFIVGWREATEVAHATIDPTTGVRRVLSASVEHHQAGSHGASR